jgi:protein-disulfide isomerase
VFNHRVQPDLVWAQLKGVGLDLDRIRADMNSPEVTQRIAQDASDAKALKVTMTPEFFVNGKPLPEFGYEQLNDLVQQELAAARS